jgi:hypothetical protein
MGVFQYPTAPISKTILIRMNVFPLAFSYSALLTVAGALLAVSSVAAQSTSFNTGTLGSAGNGINTADVTLNLSGAISAGGDLAVGYAGGAHTQLSYNPALNPPASSAFTIEFWAKPYEAVNESVGPAPVFNRVTTSPRSGWVFFQRTPATGWEFRMYDGNSSNVGFNVRAGTYTVDTWTHVVTVWDGIAPVIYVDGLPATGVSNVNGSGIYNPSTTAKLTLGSYDDGLNPYNGALDEFAFYNTALSPDQILAHYNAAFSPTAGTYSSLVKADGAVEYLQNNPVPEPTSVALIGLGLSGCAGFKRFRRK